MEDWEKDKIRNEKASEAEQLRRDRRVSDNAMKGKYVGAHFERSTPSEIDEENARLLRDRKRAEYLNRRRNEQMGIKNPPKPATLDTTHPIDRKVALKGLQQQILDEASSEFKSKPENKKFFEGPEVGKWGALKKVMRKAPVIGGLMDASMAGIQKLQEGDYAGAGVDAVEAIFNAAAPVASKFFDAVKPTTVQAADAMPGDPEIEAIKKATWGSLQDKLQAPEQTLVDETEVQKAAKKMMKPRGIF